MYRLRGRDSKRRKLPLQRYVCDGDVVIWYDMFDSIGIMVGGYEYVICYALISVCVCL